MYFLNSTARHLFCTSIKTLSRRGQHRSKIDLKLNQKVLDFELKQLKQIPSSQNSKLYKFQHPSGLKYYHIDSSNILNTFAILINNYPQNNQGISYIVQKMIQCGDTKHKIKDIIQMMKNRSFNQINTTQTTEDYYLFPFQTKSIKDFNNLLDVFLHMVYYPRMQYNDFLESRGQFYFKEGTTNGYLNITGGVYEESFVNEQLLEPQINEVLRKYFKGKNYSVIGKSGDVISAKYQDCVKYHENVFNLSNSIVYTHGDMNPVKHIESFTQFINNIKNPNLIYNKPIPQPSIPISSLPQTIRLSYLQGITPIHSFLLSYKLSSTLPTSQQIQLNILSCLLFDFPQSPFSKYLTPTTSYPKLYGYRDTSFNIGYTTKQTISDYSTIHRQKQLLDDLNWIVENGFDDGFVEAVLNQLEGDSGTEDGMVILQNVSGEMAQGKDFIEKLNISSIFKNIRREYRKKNIFQSLILKHFINNQEYLRIICQYDKTLQDKLLLRNQYKCIQHKKHLSPQQLSNILNYSPTQQLQNPSNLPIINSNNYQIFQQLNKQTKTVNGVSVVFVEKSRGKSQIVLKIDITDIEQEHINMIELYKNILPRLGSKNVEKESYDGFINKYILGVEMELVTSKAQSDSRTPDGMKLHLLLKVEFLNSNLQYAFNVLNNCVNHPNFYNLERISQIIMAQSSRIYSDISENPLSYGASYICSQFNPFLKLQDKLFHTRSFVSVAADIKKVANSKHILQYIARNMEIMHKKITQKKRYSVYVESSRDLEYQIDRYLEMLVNTRDGNELDVIDIEGFMPSKIRTYFPNFKEPMVFEGFKVPYLEKESPALTLLGSIIDSNIKKHKLVGGCYTYKGGLISYLSGGLKQFLELQKFYQDIVQVETGKRRLFQRFNSHTAYEQFKYNFQKDYVKHYKQAILATELSDIRHVVHKYIFNSLKEEENSQVMMGPHLADYSFLMKTGWTIERIIEDMSLSMQQSQIPEKNRLLGFSRLDIV